MELANIDNQLVVKAVNKLNDRIRKHLGYKTPKEVFQALMGINLRKCGTML